MNIDRLKAEGIGFLRRCLRQREFNYEGVVLQVDYQNWSPLMLRRVTTGLYELRERTMVRRILEPGDRVLEIGGGIGLVAMLCARIVGAEQVFVYEANPAVVATAMKTFQRNGEHISISNFAVVSNLHVAATVRFFVSPDFWSSSLIDTGTAHSEIEVPAVSLDDLIAKHAPNIIIADVEGAEYDIFASADLTSVQKLIIELHTRNIGAQKVSDLIQSLLNKGFRYEIKQSIGEVVYFSRPES